MNLIQACQEVHEVGLCTIKFKSHAHNQGLIRRMENIQVIQRDEVDLYIMHENGGRP